MEDGLFTSDLLLKKRKIQILLPYLRSSHTCLNSGVLHKILYAV